MSEAIKAMASKGSATPIVAGPQGGQGILQQMLPMMALSALGKSASDGNGNAGGAGGVKGLILLDVASRALPFIGGLITTWIHGRIRSRTNKLYGESQMVRREGRALYDGDFATRKSGHR